MSQGSEGQSAGDCFSRNSAHEALYPLFSAFCDFMNLRETRIAFNPVIANKLAREEEIKREIDGASRSSNKFQGMKCLVAESSAHEQGKKRERGKNSVTSLREHIDLMCGKSLQRSHSKKECRLFTQQGFAMDVLLADCRNKNCNICNGPHPTLLHDELFLRNNRGSLGRKAMFRGDQQALSYDDRTFIQESFP